MSAKIRQTIDTSESDRAFVAAFESDVDVLAKMVVEMVKENPAYLLSPVMRGLLVEKAGLVGGRLSKLRGRLCADNTGEDLR